MDHPEEQQVETKKRLTQRKKKKGTTRLPKINRPGAIEKPKKKRRFRTEISLTRQVNRAQKNAHLSYAIKRLPFVRLAREIAQNCTPLEGLRFKKTAFDALQTAAEEHLQGLFEDANAVRGTGPYKTIYDTHFAVVKNIYSRIGR